MLRIAACCAALLLAPAPGSASASASASHVDGISDQSLPAWDGSFAGSRFASVFRSHWAQAGGGQIAFARYVVQWDAMTEPTSGPHATGNYRERFEAWLEDVRSLGLTPVVALTTYDRVYPNSAPEYRAGLEAILDRANAIGYPLAYLEPWNEPNNQGGESATTAAAFADEANAVCEARRACTIVAGDFEDRTGVAGYVRDYVRALSFAPRIWGVHPYVSVLSHSERNLRRLLSALPADAAGRQLWFTEIGALYCTRGEVRGEARQASDATYLVDSLLADPAVAPEHVFYYGFLFGWRSDAPCTPAGGQDSELYTSSGLERTVARVIFSAPSAPPHAQSGGSAPSPGALGWPSWNAAASLMIGPVPDAARGS
ncbi:MAG TPA: hypothetical protein VHY83_12815 [Solirubrobacteraceae bacterium]|nr:hypothetical protein [Solirubrobacteraceae bacterium]